MGDSELSKNLRCEGSRRVVESGEEFFTGCDGAIEKAGHLGIVGRLLGEQRGQSCRQVDGVKLLDGRIPRYRSIECRVEFVAAAGVLDDKLSKRLPGVAAIGSGIDR